jgi:sucrose-6-phosphate hydrolase SacC (GH32 family)
MKILIVCGAGASSTFVALRVRRTAAARGLAVDVAAGTVCLDRSRSGRVDFHPAVAAAHAAPYLPVDGVVRLDVLVDTSSVEVFAGAGEVSLTDLVFPAPESDGVAVFAEGGACRVRSVEVTRIG